MPGSPGNQNATKHGLNGVRMNLSRMPKGADFISKRVYRFRELLESLVSTRYGEIDAYQAAIIQSSCRWEIHSRLCARWLKLHEADMTHGERLQFSREIARASSERDRSMRELGLDKVDSGNLLDAIYDKDSDNGQQTASDSDVGRDAPPARGHGADADSGPPPVTPDAGVAEVAT